MINRVVRANLLHRRMRTALVLLAIGVEVSMILLILGLADGLLGESTRRQRGVGADILMRPATSGGAALSAGATGLPESLVDELESLPEVRIAVGTTFSMQAQLLTVTGVNFDKFARMAGGIRFIEGGPFQQPFDVIVDEVYAEQNNLSPGDTLQLMNEDFRLVGIVESGKMSRVFVPLETMQEVMDSEGRLSQIFLKLHDASQAPSMVEKLKQRFPENPIWTMEEFISLFTVQTRGRADDFIAVIVGIAVTVGLIVVLMSMYTAVLERTRDIGILKALGASKAYIVQIFVRETLLLTLGGVVMGIAFAYLGESVLEERFPLVTLSILKQHLLWALGVALIGSFIGALYPAVRAARQDPIRALAYE